MLDATPTLSDRKEIDRLYAEGVHASGNSTKIHDLSVSCYVSSGEDGQGEEIHERRISDGSCRCGYIRPRGSRPSASGFSFLH